MKMWIVSFKCHGGQTRKKEWQTKTALECKNKFYALALPLRTYLILTNLPYISFIVVIFIYKYVLILVYLFIFLVPHMYPFIINRFFKNFQKSEYMQIFFNSILILAKIYVYHYLHDRVLLKCKLKKFSVVI